ncbi:MAG: hypothetical protein CGW95_03540 [Phenylobacterium zucineum]|nr:MAG: hypothetical protein CGW95_03540 [Phenylobacterium zucineum]
MSALIFALALVTAPEPSNPTAPATSAPASAPEARPVSVDTPQAVDDIPYPPDAPKDDYGLVAWCYGVLSGYLDLHDRVLPEVTRIEAAFRKPGTRLADDMAVYEDMRKLSRTNMKLFERAMEAAERASLRPINQAGAAAIAKGRASWSPAANLPTRTVAQQWMGWTLPAVCPVRAAQLEARSRLMGATFKANDTSSEVPAVETSKPPEPAAAPPPDPPPQP